MTFFDTTRAAITMCWFIVVSTTFGSVTWTTGSLVCFTLFVPASYVWAGRSCLFYSTIWGLWGWNDLLVRVPVVLPRLLRLMLFAATTITAWVAQHLSTAESFDCLPILRQNDRILNLAHTLLALISIAAIVVLPLLLRAFGDPTTHTWFIGQVILVYRGLRRHEIVFQWIVPFALRLSSNSQVRSFITWR